MDEWLRWQETLNPRGIALGLERCLPVARNLGLIPFPSPVISVAGTNGKGSCVAMLESVLTAQGYRVAAYTSPHLLRFNETVRVNARAVEDEALVAAFEAVAAARGDVMLTWFEFRTLAAARILSQARPDVAVMEVGLGGRLDAVNMFDAEVALISSIGVDHTDWLGTDRDRIGREKAGIGRPGRPAVCGDPSPPPGFLDALGEIGARPSFAGVDFCTRPGAAGWHWRSARKSFDDLPAPGIPGDCQIANAAAVLMVLELLRERFPVSEEAVRRGMARCRLPGRQEIRGRAPAVVLDVAHNPQAAEALAKSLAKSAGAGTTRAVLAMYADKDIAGVAAAMDGQVDEWHVAGLPPPRGAAASQAAAALAAAAIRGAHFPHDDVAAAFEAARRQSDVNDRIVVFGSFETVRRVLALESS